MLKNINIHDALLNWSMKESPPGVKMHVEMVKDCNAYMLE